MVGQCWVDRRGNPAPLSNLEEHPQDQVTPRAVVGLAVDIERMTSVLRNRPLLMSPKSMASFTLLQKTQ